MSWPRILCLALWLALWSFSALAPLAAQTDFERGVDAYRRGDHAEAKARWQATLEAELDDASRARVYYNLGNAYSRLKLPLPAVACFSAAARLDPRNEPAWQNLELTRAKCNLTPADPGDLGATLRRLLTSLRPSERRAVLLGALVLWVGVLACELTLGGSLLRWALILVSVVLAAAALPWVYGHLVPLRTQPMLVVESGNVSLRSEPLEARDPIGELATLEEVERLDELPGWVRVRRADRLTGWVRAEALFALRLSNTPTPSPSR